MRAPDRRAMVERPGKDLSVRRQCTLLNLARSGVYRPKPITGADDLALMRRISNSRLLACDGAGVAFKYKDYRVDGHARQKVMRLATPFSTKRFHHRPRDPFWTAPLVGKRRMSTILPAAAGRRDGSEAVPCKKWITVEEFMSSYSISRSKAYDILERGLIDSALIDGTMRRVNESADQFFMASIAPARPGPMTGRKKREV